MRKYEKHIGSVLRDEMASLVKSRNPQNRDGYKDIADIIQGKADVLFDANKTKGWARFYQPKKHFRRNKLDKSGKNGVGARRIMTLNVWKESPTQEFDMDNSGPNLTKNNAFAKGVENQFIAFSFNGDNFPDQLRMTTGEGGVLGNITAGRTGASSQFASGLFSEKDGASITFRVTNGSNGNDSNGDFRALSLTTFSLNLNTPLITGGNAVSK